MKYPLRSNSLKQKKKPFYRNSTASLSSPALMFSRGKSTSDIQLANYEKIKKWNLFAVDDICEESDGQNLRKNSQSYRTCFDLQFMNKSVGERFIRDNVQANKANLLASLAVHMILYHLYYQNLSLRHLAFLGVLLLGVLGAALNVLNMQKRLISLLSRKEAIVAMAVKLGLFVRLQDTGGATQAMIVPYSLAFFQCLFTRCSWKVYALSSTAVTIIDASLNYSCNHELILACLASIFFFALLEKAFKVAWVLKDSYKRSFNNLMNIMDNSCNILLVATQDGRLAHFNEKGLQLVSALEATKSNNIFTNIPDLRKIKTLYEENQDEVKDGLVFSFQQGEKFYSVVKFTLIQFKGQKSYLIEIHDCTEEHQLEEKKQQALQETQELVLNIYNKHQKNISKAINTSNSMMPLTNVVNQLNDINYELQALGHAFKQRPLELLPQTRTGELQPLKNGNFLLKETVCSVIDVLSAEKLNNDSEIRLKCGIIPNEVNGPYNEFKVYLFTVLENLILATDNCSSLESQYLSTGQIEISLDFNKATKDEQRKFVFVLELKGLQLSADKCKLLRKYNQANYQEMRGIMRDQEALNTFSLTFLSSLIGLSRELMGSFVLKEDQQTNKKSWRLEFSLNTVDQKKKMNYDILLANPSQASQQQKTREEVSRHEILWRGSLFTENISQSLEQTPNITGNFSTANTFAQPSAINQFYKYTRKTETLIYQENLWKFDKKIIGAQCKEKNTKDKEGKDTVFQVPKRWTYSKRSPFIGQATPVMSERSTPSLMMRQLSSSNLTDKAGKIRFLLVEDNRFGVSWMKVLLNQVGVVQVGLASDGFEAVKEYVYAAENNCRYDVVLMDLIMPGQDGYDTTIKIREFEEKNNLERSYICGNSAHIQKSAHKVLPKGFDQIISKPLHVKNIKDILLKINVKQRDDINMLNEENQLL